MEVYQLDIMFTDAFGGLQYMSSWTSEYKYSQMLTIQSQNWRFLIWHFLVFLAKFSRYTVYWKCIFHHIF